MEFIKALEEEKNKILVFRRELPLSLQLISQVIQTYKHTLNIDDSEIIASEEPVLEEFLPLRPSCSSLEEEINNNNSNDDTININDGKRDNVPDWLKSAQLWNEQPEPIVESVNNQAGGGALDTFEIETSLDLALTNSNGNGNVYEGNQGDGSHKEGKKGNSNRKSRRSWSPGLHRRFLTVLQELGGPYVSTPKMIRELMKVDDLTNDEVKSHLQKYRLHIRRSRTKPTQVVLVSNTWASPSEYAVSTIGTIPSSQAMQQQSNEQKCNTSTSLLDIGRLIISATGSSASTISVLQ